MKLKLLLISIFFIFSSLLVSAQNLVPGTGWTGVTAVPSANGVSGQYGYDANVIAHWDHVPYQDAEGTINLGILAYHISGIQKVSFSVNNGPWVDVTSPSLNPETGVDEYWVVLNENSFPTNFAGNVEVRAIAYPNVGAPKVLQGTSVIRHNNSMIVSVDRAGTLPDNIAYVTVGGNDGNNCLTPATSCATITRAMNAIAIAGNLDGAEVRLGEGAWTLPSSSGFSTPTRWFTITSITGTNRDNVIINSYASGAATSKYKLSRLSLLRGSNLYYPMGEIWIDNSKIYKPTAWTCADGSYEGGDMLGYAGPEGGNEYHAYYTDVYINNVGHGPSNLVLGRNITAEVTNDAHASGTITLINYWIKNVIQNCGAHADYYQFYANYDDIIIKGGGNIQGGNPVTRGLATSSGGLIDVAIDGINLSWNGWVFSICGPNVRNIILKNSYFSGSGNWCGESPTPVASFNAMNMANVLIKDSTFNFGNPYNLPLNLITLQPIPSPTVTYVNGSSPICSNGAIQFCSLQQGVCSGSQQICTGNNWPGCNYASISNYQSSESSCDSLDNDCDGVIDEGCQVENNTTQTQVSSSSGSSSGGSSGSSGGSGGSSSSSSQTSGQTKTISNSSSSGSLEGEDLGDNLNLESDNLEAQTEEEKFSKFFWFVLSGLIFFILLVVIISLRYLKKINMYS